MFKTRDEVIEWIYERGKNRMKLGLERMEYVMERLGAPQKKFPSIHIGGTNGKGSTTSFLRQILQEAGYTVGTFTSPYFERFEDRICVNGEPIPSEDLVACANDIKPIIDELADHPLGYPTPFEVITILGFYYFGQIRPVDIVLVEVGLGGRFDSTNVIEPLLTIITNIGHDHLHILGSTLAEIAYEKAGIIKTNTPLITAVKDEEAKEVLVSESMKNQAPIYMLNNDFSFTDLGELANGETFSFTSSLATFAKLRLGMLGKHQMENASLAIMAALLLKEKFAWHIGEEAIRKGVEKAKWPGRFEIVSGNPLVIIDGAHNKEGMETLVDTLERHYPQRRGTILFSCLKDKPVDQIMPILDSLPDDLVFTEFNFFRVEKAENLYKLSRKVNKEIALDWQGYLRRKLSGMRRGEMMVITGSLYFISLVKPFIRGIL